MKLLLSLGILCLPSPTLAAIVIVGQVSQIHYGFYGPGPLDPVNPGDPIHIVFPQDRLDDIPIATTISDAFISHWEVGPYTTDRLTMKISHDAFWKWGWGAEDTLVISTAGPLPRTYGIYFGSGNGADDPEGISTGVPAQEFHGSTLAVFEDVSPDFRAPEPTSRLCFLILLLFTIHYRDRRPAVR